MDIAEIRLAALFALSAGCKGDPAELRKFLVAKDWERVRKALSEFDVLSAHWQAWRQFGAEKPVEAYLFGSRMIGSLDAENYEVFLNCLQSQKDALPDNVIQALRENPPARFIPTHNAYVMKAGSGKEMQVYCSVRSAVVEKMSEGTATVVLATGLEEVQFDVDFFGELSVGDTVAVHRGHIFHILSPEEAESLDYWTRQISKANRER